VVHGEPSLVSQTTQLWPDKVTVAFQNECLTNYYTTLYNTYTIDNYKMITIVTRMNAQWILKNGVFKK
jgi:hypothetical protein